MSGKFSVLCKGRLIKDGRDVRAVNEITLSGDFTELLRSIVRVGGDLRFSMPGGSCVGSPSVMVRGAMISGGAMAANNRKKQENRAFCLTRGCKEVYS